MGICRCASLTSAVSAKIFSSTCDFSLIALFRSAAIGARSWSLILVLVLTSMPWVPSNRTLAVTTPPGFSFRCAPSDATTRLGNLALASSSLSFRTCPRFAWSSITSRDLIREFHQRTVTPPPDLFCRNSLFLVSFRLLSEALLLLRSVECWQPRQPCPGSDSDSRRKTIPGSLLDLLLR